LDKLVVLAAAVHLHSLVHNLLVQELLDKVLLEELDY
jgi:hypothetical protein